MDISVTIFEDNKLVREALQTILNGTPGIAAAVHLQMVTSGCKASNAARPMWYSWILKCPD